MVVTIHLDCRPLWLTEGQCFSMPSIPLIEGRHTHLGTQPHRSIEQGTLPASLGEPLCIIVFGCLPLEVAFLVLQKQDNTILSVWKTTFQGDHFTILELSRRSSTRQMARPPTQQYCVG